MKTVEKVIIPIPFKGQPLAYLDKDGRIVNSTSVTFKDFQKRNPKLNLKTITWEEFFILHDDHYCKPFVKITREVFKAALNDSQRHEFIKGYEFFFSNKPVDEYSGVYHFIYLTDKKNCYRAQKSVLLSAEEIIKSIY